MMDLLTGYQGDAPVNPAVDQSNRRSPPQSVAARRGHAWSALAFPYRIEAAALLIVFAVMVVYSSYFIPFLNVSHIDFETIGYSTLLIELWSLDDSTVMKDNKKYNNW